ADARVRVDARARPSRHRQVAQVHRLLGVARAAEGALAGAVAVADVARNRPRAPAQRAGALAQLLAVPAQQVVRHRGDVEDLLDLGEVGVEGLRVGGLHAVL